MSQTEQDDYEVITLTVKMETKPDTDPDLILTAMTHAAESVDGVLAAWEG